MTVKKLTDKKIQSLWLGDLSIETSLEKQLELKEQILQKEKKMGFFMGFEPKDSVITTGLRSNENDILWSNEKLKKTGIKKLSIKRGGEATLHSPGQLVIYPVIPLSLFSLKVKDYIVRIENISKEVFSQIGIPTEKKEQNAGLSTSTGKIAFFGVHISQGISQHGLAINVRNHLNLFSAIKSCGLALRKHDSLSKRGIKINTRELFHLWTNTAEQFF